MDKFTYRKKYIEIIFIYFATPEMYFLTKTLTTLFKGHYFPEAEDEVN